MQITKAIHRRLAIGLLVIFTSPMVLRSLHYTFVKHDFFVHQSKEIKFNENETKFCAFHHDIFYEYINENSVPQLCLQNLLYKNFNETILVVYQILINDNQTRAPPFNILLYKLIL